MSQNDFVIANQTTPAFRTDLNSALQALASQNSGATAPSTTYANMVWYDTANNILKMRNEADDAWIDLFDLDQSADTAAAYVSTILRSIEANSFAAGDVLYHNGTGLVRLAKGTAGQVLVMNSAATAPEWGGGGLSPLDNATMSSDASYDFTATNSTKYAGYVIDYSNMVPATDDVQFRLYGSTDALSSTEQATYANWQLSDVVDGTAKSTGNNFALLHATVGSAAGEYGVSGRVIIYDPSLTGWTVGTHQNGGIDHLGNLRSTAGSFAFKTTTEIDSFRLQFATGDIESGDVTVYGIGRAS